MYKKLLFLFITNVLALISTAQVAISDLEAHYNFASASLNPVVGSASGNGNNIYPATDRFGNANEAIELKRTDTSFVSLGDNFDNVFTGSSAKFSFSFWFKNGDLLNSNTQFISKYSGSTCNQNGREFTIRLNDSQRIELLYFTSLSHNNFRGYEGQTTLNDTNWHHVVVSYDATNSSGNGMGRVNIYLDNTLQSLSPSTSLGSISGGIKDGSAHLALGTLLSNSGTNCFDNESFEGCLDDIYLFSKVLDSVEIDELYNENCCPVNLQTDLRAQYQFTNGSTLPDVGTVSGTKNQIAPGTDRFGCANNALWFDRNLNSHVSLGDNFDNYIIGDSAKFSFSFWFKNGDLLNSNTQFISKYSSSPCNQNGREFTIRLNDSQKIELLYFASLSHNNFRGFEGHTAINDTNWHHAVVSYDATNNAGNGMGRVKIYLDNVIQFLSPAISLGSVSGGIKDGDAHMGLGTLLSNSGNKCFRQDSYHGYMDDINFYSRNLSSIEVDLLYNDTSSACSKIGVGEPTVTRSFSLYPNPANNSFTVEMKGNQTFQTVIIMDQTGKIIKQDADTFTGSHTMNTTSLSPGIYTVLVQAEDNKIARLLVIK